MNWDTVDFDSMPSLQEMPVTSSICEPLDGSSLPADTSEVTVKGFAWSGGGRGITRVDVSLDGGTTWQVADITAQPEDHSPSNNRSWGWTLWRADIAVPPALRALPQLAIVVKAMDTACNSQPELPAPIWNYRGLVNNSWHRVHVHLK
jgi:sulfite oxidase